MLDRARAIMRPSYSVSVTKARWQNLIAKPTLLSSAWGQNRPIEKICYQSGLAPKADLT